MSSNISKSSGGQGGKRGHSNMTHWTHTEDIKQRSRIARRQEWKKQKAKGSYD